MTRQMRITVEFSEAATFGAVDPQGEGIDGEASLRSFRNALESHLCDRYPEAKITVASGITDRVMVDGRGDHNEVPWVENIVGQVWNDVDWLEYINA